ncbi:hypothetical protein GGI25_001709 [Coemansia spiralis]|uniref:MIR domain-containing protein n=2 Tax=Coemansia TaxID=4863 RepID=A0A9W8GBZ6_9FUNG|nr:hypothetical protein EDC05_003461 [Coemansia umbellata]KAJ2624951.1 hypothetical protein GGI26_001063 [Coemansia sp. RSA 1358]KAJ2679141.1 hypothetical protein GGI25_001709 [Coemansia spiralis]
MAAKQYDSDDRESTMSMFGPTISNFNTTKKQHPQQAQQHPQQAQQQQLPMTSHNASETASDYGSHAISRTPPMLTASTYPDNGIQARSNPQPAYPMAPGNMYNPAAPAPAPAVASGPQPYLANNNGSVPAGPAARPPMPVQQPSPSPYVTAGPSAQMFTPLSVNAGPAFHPGQMPPSALKQQQPPPPQPQPRPQQSMYPQQLNTPSEYSIASGYGGPEGQATGPQAAKGPLPPGAPGNSMFYGPSNNNVSGSTGYSYNPNINPNQNLNANANANANNNSFVSSVLPGPYNTSGNVPVGPQANGPGYAPSNYVPSPTGQGPYMRPPVAAAGYQPKYLVEDPSDASGTRMGTAGKLALGALAAGAVAYGVHELVDHSSDEEKENRKRHELVERQRREAEARRRREEEEIRRHEDYERWRREEDERRQQQMMNQAAFVPAFGPMSGRQTPAPQPQPLRHRAESVSSYHSHHSHHSSYSNDGAFVPPAPFGRPPYSFNPNDLRYADPSRSSENSPTPQIYPELRQSPSDPVIKIGTVIALKHIMTGRFLHSDRSHSTQTGSNQQLVFGHRRNADTNDWWQVLPANQDVPVPGSIVTYGTQLRLRHMETGRHLHSHYNYKDRMGNNEVTAFGDQTVSDEYDHWLIERWGDGGYGSTWKSTDTVVLRHYVSGMALHSHDVMLRDDVQSVVCTGNGASENARWRVSLDA